MYSICYKYKTPTEFDINIILLNQLFDFANPLPFKRYLYLSNFNALIFINLLYLAKSATKNISGGKKNVQVPNKNVIDLDNAVSKYFWLVIPILAVVYYISSKYSQGFYQDDEISQYLNMIDFWSNPAVILGNNPKPGYKIFMVVPALFGYQPVLMVNSIVAALTVFFTYKMLKIYNVNYAFFGALLLATQPLFFDLSFRSYSEIFTSLVIVIFLILYKKEHFLTAALVAGYIFTIRQEIAIFCIILGIIFMRQKRWKEFIAIGIFPIIYNLLGYLKTGDLMYVMSEVKNVAGLKYETQPLYHYFKVYIFIVGPVSLALFLQGFFGFFADTKKMKEYFNKYLLFYVLFITVFLVQIYTMWNNGPNPGNWRYLLHISPICVFFATVGLNNLTVEKFRKFNFIISGILILFTFAFFSKTSDGFKLLEVTDYTKVIFLIIFLSLTVIISNKNPKDYLNKLSIILVLASIAYLAIDFTPKKLSSENLTVKNASEFLNSPDFKGKTVLSNHSLIQFWSDGYRANPKQYISVNSKNINEAPAGSIVVWDNHYGYRPEWGSDVKIETLQSDKNLKLINQFVSPDKRFVVYVFEKIG